ncbi:hypothetical protein NDN08_007131 [Rhodosorus marinus]|uniref:AAA+ ATPase domain-containing protein n=1 Tax=Rhodosorus marinus TaxID=101924 RepID=A0AAV8UJD3_9RHOD|nr:hypothetical protein NDN08_007131 [Rhodosorus marinus]
MTAFLGAILRYRPPVLFQSSRAFSTHELANNLIHGDRVALSRSITLVESSLAEHRVASENLLDVVSREISRRKSSIRIGISGSPGVGKSSFIESIGGWLVSRGTKVAVLTIDPSSMQSGGSLLGDKTRMELLARHPLSFVRSTPTRGFLGGLSRSSDEALTLCEGAGYDVTFVESVGIGQSETALADVVDVFVLLIAPSAGDELQGMKKGVLEHADFIVINKADGSLLKLSKETKHEFALSVAMNRRKHSFWQPPLLLSSNRAPYDQNEPQGEPDTDSVLHPGQLWPLLTGFRDQLDRRGLIEKKKIANRIAWTDTEAVELARDLFKNDPELIAERQYLIQQLSAGSMSSRSAARHLVSTLRGSGQRMPDRPTSRGQKKKQIPAKAQ